MEKYLAMINAQGYYCNACDRYHAPHEMKHRYTLETLGEWDGKNATIVRHDVFCPSCGYDDELEDFDLRLWSHLIAYKRATGTPMTFVYPLFDRETNGEAYGWERVTDEDELESIAHNYCIEVLEIGYVDGVITVKVDLV